jgi:Zn-dependent oligopeptidase
MGHAYHGLTSNRPQYARFHGTRTARDFVECPSQSNENWCFIPEVMRKVSKHYKTGETIPDELINKIIKGDATNKGLFNLRQLYFGLFDLEVHTSKQDIDYTKLWNEKREEVALTSIGDAELPAGQGSFAHLVGGASLRLPDSQTPPSADRLRFLCGPLCRLRCGLLWVSLWYCHGQAESPG